MNEMKERNGLWLVVLGAIAFSLGGLLVKLLPLSPLSISSGRCVFSSLVIYLYIRISHHRVKINKVSLAGALCVMAMLLCYVASMKLTTAANAIVLEYTAPVFVLLLEMALFQKRPKRSDVLFSLLVLLGIIIVVSDGLAKGNLIGDLLALASGVFYALTIMLNDFEGGDSLTSVLLGHIFCVFAGLPSLLSEGEFALRTFALLAFLGIFQAGAGYTLLTVGLKHCEPLPASLAASIEPVLNPILVAVFYGEYVSGKAFLGAAIVIGSIVLNQWLSMKRTGK